MAIDAALAILTHVFLLIPTGLLIVDVAVPIRGHLAARLALAGSTGYVAITLIGLGLGLVEQLRLLPVVGGLAIVLCVLRFRARVPEWVRMLGSVRTRGEWQALAWLLAILGLTIVAESPLFSPIRIDASGQRVSYAYIDAYQSLTLLQGLVRHLPTTDHYALSGLAPRLYPDFHYAYLSLVERLTRIDVDALFFRDGAILLALLGIPLAYAIGRELVGRPLGGHVAATLLGIVVIPNPYDFNRLLANVPVPFMPTFYQAHFFSPRFNQHEGAGGMLLLSASVALLLAERATATRPKVGALVLAGCFVGAMVRWRSQHVVAIAPAFAVVTVGLAVVRRDWRTLAGPLALGGMAGLLALQSFSGRYDTSASHLIVRYGTAGRQILDGWYLPARMTPYVAALPPLLAPSIAVLVFVAFRVVGTNLATLILVRAAQLGRERHLPSVIELFWLAGIAGACATALLIERSDQALGMQVLPIAHLLAVLLSIAGLTAIVCWTLPLIAATHVPPPVVGAVALAMLTFVAHRAADAALHDQPHRAYSISSDDRDAYRWIREKTSPTAVIAAHPNHRVNESGETITQTDVLSAFTNRPVFLQRTGLNQRPEGAARADRLRRLFNERDGDRACANAADLTFDYLLVFGDFPLAAPQPYCLPVVYRGGGVRVHQLVHGQRR